MSPASPAALSPRGFSCLGLRDTRLSDESFPCKAKSTFKAKLKFCKFLGLQAVGTKASLCFDKPQVCKGGGPKLGLPSGVLCVVNYFLKV